MKMNRFIKDNIVLVFSIALTSVVALGLLVYGVIQWVRISELMEETNRFRSKIKTLIKASPAPTDDNKPLLQEDTDAYNKLYSELVPVFETPLRKARNEFLKKLCGPQANIDEEAQKFLDLYNERVRSDASLTERRIAWTKLLGELKNWNSAIKVFIDEAHKAGVDPDILDKFATGAILAELGIPRTMNEDAAEFQRFYNSLITHLRERMGDRLNSNNNFGLPVSGYSKEDYPFVARQAVILSDIVGKIASSGINSFNGMIIRGSGEGAMGSTFSEENGCRISHYTLEVSGSLDAIRELAANFDKAQKDKRFYIVRSVFIRWPDNEKRLLKEMINPPVQNQLDQENQSEPESVSTGLFGGGRRARLARQKQLEAEQKEKMLEKERNATEEKLREREKNAKIHERHGYGEVKVNEIIRFTAVFDIDYIERI